MDARSCLLFGFLSLHVSVGYGAHSQDLTNKEPVTWFEADPSWPKSSPALPRGQTPGIAVDAQDHIWIFARANPPIRVYDGQGELLRSWGQGVIGSAHFLRFDSEGQVWIADVGSHVVRKFTPEGRLLMTLGVPGVPGQDAKHFNKPTDMAITPTGEIFVTDGYGNNRIVHFGKNGKFINSWGRLGDEPGEFNLPHSIVVDSKGLLYVADRNNARVQVFRQNGEFLSEWRNLMIPYQIWITPSDDIWICGSSPMPWLPGQLYLGVPPKDQLVMKFDTKGKVRLLWTFPKGEGDDEAPGTLNGIHGVAADSRENLYIGDIFGQKAQKFLRH